MCREGAVGRASGGSRPSRRARRARTSPRTRTEVRKAHEAAPQQRHGHHHHQERQQDGGDVHVAFESGHRFGGYARTRQRFLGQLRRNRPARFCRSPTTRARTARPLARSRPPRRSARDRGRGPAATCPERDLRRSCSSPSLRSRLHIDKSTWHDRARPARPPAVNPSGAYKVGRTASARWASTRRPPYHRHDRAAAVGQRRPAPRGRRGRGRPSARPSGRQPVDGPRMVRRLNIDGDGQGDRLGHGGEHRAVFVYQLDSYRYWQRELGRDDFTLGQFGENFTVEGLADDEVCIGDRYRIGAALFEVTQPRVTCYRVGHPDGRAGDAVAAGRPPPPGLLPPRPRGGRGRRPATRSSRSPTGPERDDASPRSTRCSTCPAVARAARAGAAHPGAEPGLAGQLPRAARQGRRHGRGARPRGPGFRPLRVAEIRPRERDHHARSGSCPPTTARRRRPRRAGQYLTLRLRPDAGAPPLVRSYSLSDLPGERGYRISVKREGAGSRYLHDHVAGRRRARGRGAARRLRPARRHRPGRAGQRRRRRDAGAGDAARARRRRAARDRSGGSTARATATSTPSPTRSTRCSRRCRTRTALVAYSRPAGGRRRRRLRRRRAARPRGRSSGPASRRTPTTTSADPTASCARSAPRSPRAESRPTASHTEVFGAVADPRPGIVRPATGRRTRPTARRAPARRHVRPQRPGRRRGTTGYREPARPRRGLRRPRRLRCRTGVCHNCESGLLAGAVSYAPSRSNRRPQAGSSSAAAGPPPS